MATNHWHMNPRTPEDLDALQADIRQYLKASHKNPAVTQTWKRIAMAMTKTKNPSYETYQQDAPDTQETHPEPTSTPATEGWDSDSTTSTASLPPEAPSFQPPTLHISSDSEPDSD